MDSFLQACALGLLGAAHCAGMCGVFSAAVGATCRGRARRRFAGRMAAYLAGKTLSYSFLGAAAGAALGTATASSDELILARQVATWLALFTILVTGLKQGGWLPGRSWPPPRWLHRAGAALRPLFSAWTRLPGAWGAAALGLVNGFLPCGLTAAAVLLAAGTQRPLYGAALMAAFGAATAPALLLPAWSSRLAASAARPALRKLAASLLVALALVSGWRQLDRPPAAASCCDAPAAPMPRPISTFSNP